jgi:hypothetical protein
MGKIEMTTEGGDYEYNMAALTFRRIHVYLVQANESRRAEDLISWFKNLELLKTEIAPYMNKKEDKKEDFIKVYEFCRNCYFQEKNNNGYFNPSTPKTLNIAFYRNLEKLHDLIMTNLEKKRMLMRKGKEYQLQTW